MLRLALGVILVLAMLNTGRAYDDPSPDMSGLMKLISENNDPHITAIDLAFFLATHNYDVTPKEGYVVVRLDKKSYKLIPNGKEMGLAEIVPI